jgi:Ca2+-binding EF-hand superfamily protein
MTLSTVQISKLWEAFSVFDTEGNGSISLAELAQVTQSLGQSLHPAQLREMLREVDTDNSGSIDFAEFQALMISQVGDRRSRLELAFSVFDENNNGYITLDELQAVMGQFGLSEAELKAMLQEVDKDGDGAINLAEFMEILPEEVNIKSTYKDAPPRPQPQANTNPSRPSVVKPISGTRGTSILQMQIGMFRLIQGAAYRSFRESFSAHHETHLQVRNLPYRIGDFVHFVQTAIALYKALGIVETECHPLLDAVVTSLEAEYGRLQQRIQNWDSVSKTPQMLAEVTAMESARQISTQLREKFASGVEFALTLKKKHLSFRDVSEGILALNELNRLRSMEINAELESPSHVSAQEAQTYLEKWHRVIIEGSEEVIAGAMMPVAYWYEDFMPKLLTAFSVSKADDIAPNTHPEETALNEWYESLKTQGDFSRYGSDILEYFPRCSPSQKLSLQQAWRLTHHYLNGLQKRREREEFGWDSGVLSQYVAFIDAYLGRTDVRDAQMRVSFPYYLGPAVWCFFHTMAEIVCTQTPTQQTELIKLFKEFIISFAKIYPCPYCRHHFNAYVILNREVELYPVEYLLLGKDPQMENLGVYLDAKLSTVVDGSSLRLFFWKLHNTVSASIARSETWYHRDDKAFYTSRYWPSLDTELARAQALGIKGVETERLYDLYRVLKPMAELANLRKQLGELITKDQKEQVPEICAEANVIISQLEKELIDCGFLQKAYYFDPHLQDEEPFFSPAEESFARSGLFIEE